MYPTAGTVTVDLTWTAFMKTKDPLYNADYGSKVSL